MTALVVRTLQPLAVPALVLVGMVVLATFGAARVSMDAAVVQLGVIAAIAGSAVLALRFGRTRVLLALVSVAFLAAPLLYAPDNVDTQAALALASVLVPTNLAIWALSRERGWISPWGIARMAFMSAQALAAAAAVRPDRAARLDVLSADFLPVAVTVGELSDAAIVASLAALLAAGFTYVRRRTPTEAGFVAAVLAVAFATAQISDPIAPLLYVLGAGLAFGFALVESTYTFAYRDELTGLPGRRALNELLGKLGGTYAIAMLDVDKFKKFNDKYGHDVGDDVLRMVAAKLAGVGGGGRAFRYGGEEFTVVFPGKTAAGADRHLEKLRETIEKAGLTIRGPDRPKRKPKKGASSLRGGADRKRVSVTISIGVATRSGTRRAPEAVIKEADKLLYDAKRGGRNRVVVEGNTAGSTAKSSKRSKGRTAAASKSKSKSKSK